MKEGHNLSVNIVNMHLMTNITLSHTLRESMKERNHLSVNFVNMQQLTNNTLTYIFRIITRVWSNTFTVNLNVNFVHTPLIECLILINTFNQFMKKRSHVDIFMHILHLTVHKQNVNQHLQVGLLTLLATVCGGNLANLRFLCNFVCRLRA